MTPWQLALEILFIQFLVTQSEKIIDPTVKPADPFSAQADAEAISKGLDVPEGKGLGNVNAIWFHRTYDQRLQINTYFHETLGKESLRTSLDDVFSDSMHALYWDSINYSPPGLLAYTLFRMISGIVQEEGVIEEIVCCNDADFKKLVAESYLNEQGGDTIESKLDEWAGSDVEYKQVLQRGWDYLCQEKKITPEDSDKEAKALLGINPEADGVAFKNKLNELLDKNCEPDMKQIFEKYRLENKGIGIVEAVAKSTKGTKAEIAWDRLVRYIEDTCKLYADLLETATGSDGVPYVNRINRITLTRCERDLACIIKKDVEIYGKTATRDRQSENNGEIKGNTFLDRMKAEKEEDIRYRNSILFLCGKA